MNQRKPRGKGAWKAVAALACSLGLMLACAGCSLNDVSSSVRGSTSGAERKAKEVPRDPDFSNVFHNGG